MVEFTNVKHTMDLQADLPIKYMKKFQKNLEEMLKKEFVFQEAVSDPLSLYNIAITGIKEGDLKTVLTPKILYTISDGPYEIAYNKRLRINRDNPDVTDASKYGFEKYVQKLVNITSDAADKSN